MPCSDGYGPGYGGTTYVDNPRTQERLDRATRVACEAFHRMTPNQIGGMTLEARTWWKNHQEADRRREEREEAERKRKQDRINALGKLSDRDKKVLGL